MSKIKDTLYTLQSGARLNKYRILLQDFGQDMDIVCNATVMPGRSLSTTEVFVKGRKYRLAAESEDEGVWEITFYNTPDLFHRRVFLAMIGNIHNFSIPSYLGGTGINSDAPLSNGGDFGRIMNIILGGSSNYKQDIVIQQLDFEESVIGEAIIHNAFVTTVGSIEYSDETQGVSTTSVTFTWSGITFQ